MSRPNAYDNRQMRVLQSNLTDCLRQVDWMLEEDRSNEDRALRALMIRYRAAQASRVARNFQRRFYRYLGWNLWPEER